MPSHDNNSSNSPDSQAKKTVNESKLNPSPPPETLVESNLSSPQPQKTVDELILQSSPPQKKIVESDIHKDSRPSFVRKDSLEGKTVGDNNRYLLQTLLGQGGMSKVYRALDTKFEDRIVAVKVMTHYSDAISHHLIKRFMREVNDLSKLKHINTIQILDFGITPKGLPFNGVPFYVMEYFAGQTLHDLLTKNKSLSINSLINIICQVCDGLKEAHQKGIVHRDLKPDNIFLVDGVALGKIVKIIDFGIAKNISSDKKDRTQLTQVGAFIGTYRYASPEQCRGLKNIDHRSDIYSLGIIFYEAICGKNPYDLEDDVGITEGDWIACHIRVPPKPLKEQLGCEQIDDKLANVVMKCLAKKPEQRFSNIEELQQALSSVNIKQEPVETVEETLQTKATIEEQLPLQEIKPKRRKEQELPLKEIKKEIKSTVIEEQLEPQTITKNNLLKLLAIIVSMFLLGIGGGLYFIKKPSVSSNNPGGKNPPIPDLNSLIANIENQHNQEQYQECYDSAINTVKQDEIKIGNWVGKCGLAVAKAKAENNDYTDYIDAIAIADTIPSTASNYQEVQENINIWAENILKYADTVYQEKGIEEAIKITNNLPERENIQAQVKNSLTQWQNWDKKYQKLIDTTKEELEVRKAYCWVQSKIKEIPPEFKYWSEKAKPILKEAEVKEAQEGCKDKRQNTGGGRTNINRGGGTNIKRGGRTNINRGGGTTPPPVVKPPPEKCEGVLYCG